MVMQNYYIDFIGGSNSDNEDLKKLLSNFDKFEGNVNQLSNAMVQNNNKEDHIPSQYPYYNKNKSDAEDLKNELFKKNVKKNLKDLKDAVNDYKNNENKKLDEIYNDELNSKIVNLFKTILNQCSRAKGFLIDILEEIGFSHRKISMIMNKVRKEKETDGKLKEGVKGMILNEVSDVKRSYPQVKSSSPQVKSSYPQVKRSSPQVKSSYPQVKSSYPQVQKAKRSFMDYVHLCFQKFIDAGCWVVNSGHKVVDCIKNLFNKVKEMINNFFDWINDLLNSDFVFGVFDQAEKTMVCLLGTKIAEWIIYFILGSFGEKYKLL